MENHIKAEKIFHYQKSRKKHSRTFINMGVMSLLYISGIYGYEHFQGQIIDDNTKNICIISFSIASIILFYIAWWLRTHPAEYEAIITHERFIIRYPESAQWSFDIKIADIKRFEHRNTLNHAGRGIGKSGVLMNDGRFYQISMNYGGNINKMFKAVKSIKPDVTFPKRVNLKISGPLSKDFDE